MTGFHIKFVESIRGSLAYEALAYKLAKAIFKKKQVKIKRKRGEKTKKLSEQLGKSKIKGISFC